MRSDPNLLEERTEPLKVHRIASRRPEVVRKDRRSIWERSLLSYLWSMRYQVIGICGLAVGIAYLVTLQQDVLYSSSVTMLVDEGDVAPDRTMDGFGEHHPQLVELFHTSTSTELLDHLISKFDLSTRYGIDPSSKLRREEAMAQLLDRIEARLIDQNALLVTVRDADRDTAASMANEVFEELVRITTHRAMSGVQRAMTFWSEVAENSQQLSNKQMDRLTVLIDSISGSGARIKLGRNAELTDALQDLVSKLANSNEDLRTAGRNYEVYSNLLRKSGPPKFYLTRGAMADIFTSPRKVILGQVSIAGLIAILGALVVLSFWHQHGRDLIAYFTTAPTPGE